MTPLMSLVEGVGGGEDLHGYKKFSVDQFSSNLLVKHVKLILIWNIVMEEVMLEVVRVGGCQ